MLNVQHCLSVAIVTMCWWHDYLITCCTYGISLIEMEVIDPKNVVNDILHATSAYSIDGI